MDTTKNHTLLTYTSIFEPAAEGGYVVSVPALPGCTTQGDTFEEAQQMTRDAIQGYLAILAEEGADMPQEAGHSITAQVSVPSPV
jgi:antitoxin HicB